MQAKTLVRALVAGVCALALTVTGARAQWPESPIRIVVPWPAGGGSDVVARVVAKPLGEALKQSVVIVNQPGANGAIGSQAVANSKPDGYTLIWVTADTHAMNPHVYPKLAYDPRKDFAGVGIVGYFPYVLVVNPMFAAKNLSEFVALAKQQAGKFTYASWGIGGSAHVAMEMFRAQAGFEMLHVPYQGAAPAIQGVVAGNVDAMIVPMSVAAPQASGDRLRILGIASPKRFSGAPELKTFSEQGVDVDAGTWVGLMAPAGTPKDVLAKLNSALKTIVADPQVRDQLIKMNVDPAAHQTPEGFQAFIASEYERWGKTIRGANIKVE